MPKMKTSRAAAKRFKKTGTGKLVHEAEHKKRGIDDSPFSEWS